MTAEPPRHTPPASEWRKTRFGDFEVDLAAGELRRRGLKLPLAGIPIRILEALLERPGEVVTRQELRRRIWPQGTYVDFDNSLNSAVNRLRTALGDSAEHPRYLETLRRRGYRFLAAVAPIPRPADGDNGAVPTASAPRSAAKPLRRRIVLATAATAVALTLAYASDSLRSQPPAGGGTDRRMLAVLPFEDLSGDPGEAYFVDGLTEEMISQIGRLAPRRLGVIARSSAMRYRDTDVDLAEIGASLGVELILEGSVRRSGDRVRITTRLARVDDRSQIWTGTYERDLADVLSLQEDVARAVALQIGSSLALSEEPEPRRTLDPRAYEAYLRGLHHRNRRTPEGMWRSAEYFEQAIAIAPGHARSHAGLAETFVSLGTWQLLPWQEAARRARQAALRSLELDDSLAPAYSVLAVIAYEWEWDWERSEMHFRKALELDPNHAATHQRFAGYLTVLGRHDEARTAIERAAVLDPLSLTVGASRGYAAFFARRYREAERRLDETLELDPDFPPALLYRSWLYRQQDRLAEAEGDLERALAAAGDFSVLEAELGYTRALAGDRDGALATLRRLLPKAEAGALPPNHIGILYLGLGDLEAACDWFRRGHRQRDHTLLFLQVDPRLDGFRSHPCYADLLARMAFPEV